MKPSPMVPVYPGRYSLLRQDSTSRSHFSPKRMFAENSSPAWFWSRIWPLLIVAREAEASSSRICLMKRKEFSGVSSGIPLAYSTIGFYPFS